MPVPVAAHAAHPHAPVALRSRHTLCTQALPQQPNHILSNTLPRPASSSVRLRRSLYLRILHPSTSRRRRRRRFAEGLCSLSLASSWPPRNVNVLAGIGQRFPMMMSAPHHRHFLRQHLMGVMGWLYPIGCYPRINSSSPGRCDPLLGDSCINVKSPRGVARVSNLRH